MLCCPEEQRGEAEALLLWGNSDGRERDRGAWEQEGLQGLEGQEQEQELEGKGQEQGQGQEQEGLELSGGSAGSEVLDVPGLFS